MMKNSEQYIDICLASDFYETIAQGSYSREFYPCYSNRDAWKNAAKSPIAARIIAEADKISDNQVPQLLFSNYRQFAVNGNRTEYEEVYFQRRKELGFLALALCITADKEKYMPRLLDYTVAILEERTWCIPAHARWEKDNADRWKFCDLFAAETSAVMALLYSILGCELEKEIPGIADEIKNKTLQRSVYTVFDKNIEHWWDTQEIPANWTVWCSSNCIIVSLLLEDDGRKRVDHLKRFLANTSRFITHFADDGYCPEGPSYYMKANLMVFQTLLMLHKALPGSMDKLFADNKLKSMMEFLVNAMIGGNIVTFGDGQPGLQICPALVYPAGKYFNSELIKNMPELDEERLGACGDFLASMLQLLFDAPVKDVSNCSNTNSALTVFKSRLAVFRSNELSLSLKTGNNDEPHNHNDLGHFELFSKKVPVIIDAGTGAYAKIHFSDLRYTLWNVRGNGHNAPVFGAYEQVAGEEYKADFSIENGSTLYCDLSQAYPEEAKVKSFERKIQYSSKEVIVEDDFVLEKPLKASVTLLTVCAPEIIDEHTIRLGDVILSLQDIAFVKTSVMPELKHPGSGVLRNIWGADITAITLETEKNQYKMVFKQA